MAIKFGQKIRTDNITKKYFVTSRKYVINKLKHLHYYYLTALWIYRKIPANEVCCCGVSLDNHNGWYAGIPPRCAKEYAVTSYVESKLKENK